jgi:hypothetical protein
MTANGDIRRIAEAHAEFYADHADKELASFVQEYWHPDVKMYFAGLGSEPRGLDAFLQVHSSESGFSWNDTFMEVERLVVGEDAFVLKFAIVRWRSHEADAAAASDGSEAESTDYVTGYIPSINIYTVEDGKVVRTDSMIMVPASMGSATGS